MFKKFSFYKTILLALASAVTLISVSFAWFTNPTQVDMGALSSYRLSDSISVTFYKEDSENPGRYDLCSGDFVSSFEPSGGSVNYKIIVKKSSSDSINLKLNLLGIGDISSELKNNVYIDYKLYVVTDNGDGTYTDKTFKSGTTEGFSEEKLIANIGDGNILSASLDDGLERTYAIYYTVSLKSSAEVSNVTGGNLGQLQVAGSVAS